jgi:hypothetical protein
MIYRFDPLCGIKILVAFSHMVFLRNCLVRLCHRLDASQLMSILKFVHAIFDQIIIFISS